MCPNTEERQQQGFVNIVRKGINTVIKTDDGYLVQDDYEKLDSVEKLKLVLSEGALDLHIHTNASDGFDSPPRVVKLVMQQGLKTFSITDHDTLWGVKDALMILEKLRQMRVRDLPRFIPGVELSVDLEGQEIHVLGYFPSGGYTKIQGFLDASKEMRISRNMELCQRLTDLGFPITYKELMKEGGQVLGRVHVATVMARRGFVSSVDAAFDEYLAEGKPAFVDRNHPKAEAGIKEILNAGGLPVLAHPAVYGWTSGEEAAKTLSAKLKKLKSMGMLGVETIHGDTRLADSKMISEVAKNLKLLRTVGSDFHGSNKPKVKLYKPEQDFSEYLIS